MENTSLKKGIEDIWDMAKELRSRRRGKRSTEVVLKKQEAFSKLTKTSNYRFKKC